MTQIRAHRMSDDTLQCTEIDGVPAFWVSGEGPLRASLWFRAGMTDETLPTRGWLHLLEHLALHGRDTIRAPINGHVELLLTSFDIEGEPAEVTEFLQAICEWLSEPKLDRLDHELRVLRAESEQRPVGSLSTHLLWRYGAQGPGLAGYDEFGLYGADAAGLRTRAAEVFTRGNAGLALAGPPPAGLRLALPNGPRLPTPSAVPCEQPAPGGFPDRPGAIAVSGAVPRSVAGIALARALERSLQLQLRHGAGMGYSAWSSYEPVDANHAMVTAGIDILPEALATVVGQTCAVVERLRDRGPDPTELRDDIDRQIRQLRQSPADWQPFLAVRDVLLGRPARTRTDLAAEIQTVTAADVQRAAGQLWGSLLLSTDPDSTIDHRITLLTAASTPPSPIPTGRTFKSINHPIVRRTLVVGSTGAHYEEDDLRLTTGYGDLVAVVSYPDGGRRLVRRDGYHLAVEPTLFKRGREAVELLDSAVPLPLQVRLPARPPEQIPRSVVPVRQYLRYWFSRPWMPAPLFLVGCGTILLAVNGVGWYHIPTIFMGVAAYSLVKNLTRSEQ